MNNLKREIEEELAILKYYHKTGELKYQKLVDWLAKRYNDDEIFERVMIESIGCHDALEMFDEVFNTIELSEDILLSKIAQEFFTNEINLDKALSSAYNLLNCKGDGYHLLSPTLYTLVDGNDSETLEEYLERAKNSNFIELLQKYNTGQWKKLYEQVFNQT